jgi:HK97 gp10 family phage protein
MREALEAAADTAVRSAKRRAPVLTGRLRSSIHRTDVQGSRGRYWIAIQTNVPYARHLEYGTLHESAHPFMRPAARSGSRKLAREVKARFPKR